MARTTRPGDEASAALALDAQGGVGPDGERAPLAFLGEREALVRRFLLAELLAPPAALRRHRRGARR
jgi:hypothetical protein